MLVIWIASTSLGPHHRQCVVEILKNKSFGDVRYSTGEIEERIYVVYPYHDELLARARSLLKEGSRRIRRYVVRDSNFDIGVLYRVCSQHCTEMCRGPFWRSMCFEISCGFMQYAQGPEYASTQDPYWLEYYGHMHATARRHDSECQMPTVPYCGSGEIVIPYRGYRLLYLMDRGRESGCHQSQGNQVKTICSGDNICVCLFLDFWRNCLGQLGYNSVIPVQRRVRRLSISHRFASVKTPDNGLVEACKSKSSEGFKERWVGHKGGGLGFRG
ncbi:hypothetical protein Tco_0651958 [Tanacetum coccineum]|uniref:Uncharacterized protein n=1 Tax=Tanacetum coccineum TaxID=301880 RepID=A0ABQ4WW74_9ASTR